MSGQVGDVLNRFEEAMEKIDGMEKSFETKLDNKFNELLTRLPQPPSPVPIAPLQRQKQHPLLNQLGRAKRVPIEDSQTHYKKIHIRDILGHTNFFSVILITLL